MEAMVPYPIPPKNTLPPISTSTHQIIQENHLSPPPPLLLSIPETKRKERRQTQTQTQTLEQSFEESLELEAVSDISYAAASRAKKKRGVVRLRLARFGRKNAPFYRIHAADSRCRRDGKFLERIGYYDPRRPGKDGQKRIALNFERAKYWLSVGAQPSDTVRHIFSLAGLLPKPPVPQMSKKGDGLAGILEEEEEIDAEEEEEDADGESELLVL